MVTTVASLAHQRGSAALLEGDPRRRYRPERSYADSKLANLLFAFELQRQAERHGTRTVSNAAHPGVAATHLVASDQGLGSIPGVSRLAPARPAAGAAVVAAGRGAHAVRGRGRGARLLLGSAVARRGRGPVGSASPSVLARDEALAASCGSAAST